MTICDLNGKKPEISYPVVWQYKVITLANTKIEQISQDVFDNRKCTIKNSSKSKKGKYQSYNIDIEVKSQLEREKFFQALKNHNLSKFVL